MWEEVVKITTRFDYFPFKGGLQPIGIVANTVQGTVRYKIQHYIDLDVLFGKNWTTGELTNMVIIPTLF